MPLLQSIVAELDRELDRLEQIRRIIAGLSRTPALVRQLTAIAPEPEVTVLVPSKAHRKPRSDAGQRRGPRTQKASVEERALTAMVPSGPVVFNPARLAEERARRQETREVPAPPEAASETPEDLDALSRSLAARWSTGLVQ